jgi:hypothetical protein
MSDDRTHAWRLSSTSSSDAITMKSITITRYLPGWGSKYVRFTQGTGWPKGLQRLPWHAAILWVPSGMNASRLM